MASKMTATCMGRDSVDRVDGVLLPWTNRRNLTMTQSRERAIARPIIATAIHPSSGMEAKVSTIAEAADGRGLGSGGALEKMPIVAGRRLVARGRPHDVASSRIY